MLKILHISDLHFKEETIGENAGASNMFSDLLVYLSEISAENKFDYIFITGDIGNRGCKESYVVAQKEISTLLKQLNVDRQHLFICPGNHDLIREKLTEQISTLRKQSKEKNQHNSSITPANNDQSREKSKDEPMPETLKEANEILKVENFGELLPIFEHYSKFCEGMGLCKFKIDTIDNYLVGDFQTDDFNIVCLNTVWFANHKDAKLWVGKNFVNIIEKHIRDINTDLMTITIFHHPTNLWHISEKQNYNDGNCIYDSIKKFSDMILFGHTHESTSSHITSSENTFICAAGVGHWENVSHNFKVYEVDEVNKTVINAIEHRWDKHDWHAEKPWINEHYHSENPINLQAQREDRNPLLDRYYENIRNKFENGKTALGENYHLKDIYINPSLTYKDKIENTYKEKNAIGYVQDWMEGKEDSKIMLLLGEPGHGKSSFCIKMVYNYIVSGFEGKKVIYLDLKKDVDFEFKNVGISNIEFKILGESEIKLEDSLIFLDGYDEIYTDLKEKNINTEDFLLAVNVKSENLNSHIVVTSRTNYIDNRKALEYYNIVELADLKENEQIKWIQDFNEKEPDNKFTVESLKEIILNNNPLYMLMSIPILFQLIVKHNFMKQASTKAELYSLIFQDVIIRTDKNMRSGNIELKEAQLKLQELAFDIFKNDDRMATIKEIEQPDKYKSIIYSFYVKEDSNSDSLCHIEFLHRSFYQYFLAYHLYKKFSECHDREKTEPFLAMLFYRNIERDVLTFMKEIYQIKKPNKEEIPLMKMKEISTNILGKIISTNCIIHSICGDEMNDRLILANNIFVNSCSILFILLNVDKKSPSILKNLKEKNKVGFDILMSLFRKYDCTSIFLSGAGLIGADLSEANLSEANFINADLNSANLSGANLIGADLSEANLSEANLSYANLSYANLNYANLTSADLSGAYLCNVDLSGANLSGADLSNADLSGADLRGANLSDAGLSGADLSNADLSGADLRGADLRGVDLSRANLRSTDLRDANLRDANLSSANLNSANLSGAYLFEVDLSNANLSNANLSNVVLSSTDFSDANLCDANLRNVDLNGVNLSGADLSRTDFSDANLTGAKVDQHALKTATFSKEQLKQIAIVQVLSNVNDL